MLSAVLTLASSSSAYVPGVAVQPAARTHAVRQGAVFMDETIIEKALAGELDGWAEGRGSSRVALILLLDQFTRNLFRGQAKSYAGDAKALALTKRTSAEEQAAFHPVERYFLLIPWEHSEVLADQEAGVAAFERARAEVPPAFTEFFAEAEAFAERHRVVIERFGRFPARNAALSRTPTTEEEAYPVEHPDGLGAGRFSRVLRRSFAAARPRSPPTCTASDSS